MMKLIFSLCSICFCVLVNAQNTSTEQVQRLERLNVSAPPYMDLFVAADQDLVVVQWKNLNTADIGLQLQNASKTVIETKVLFAGTTIAYFDTKKLYAGQYEICIPEGKRLLCTAFKIEK